mmetsp:Transcript_64513/g.207772  ORF Transcript_64513/g.207772 Transcript_64513/m.207772 type:complete len:249 (+) Transcript_64513:4034-4780(+)
MRVHADMHTRVGELTMIIRFKPDLLHLGERHARRAIELRVRRHNRCELLRGEELLTVKVFCRPRVVHQLVLRPTSAVEPGWAEVTFPRLQACNVTACKEMAHHMRELATEIPYVLQPDVLDACHQLVCTTHHFLDLAEIPQPRHAAANQFEAREHVWSANAALLHGDIVYVPPTTRSKSARASGRGGRGGRQYSIVGVGVDKRAHGRLAALVDGNDAPRRAGQAPDRQPVVHLGKMADAYRLRGVCGA